MKEIRAYPGMSARGLAAITGIEPYVVRKRTADLRNHRFAHSHEGRAVGDRELRWWPDTWCAICEREKRT